MNTATEADDYDFGGSGYPASLWRKKLHAANLRLAHEDAVAAIRDSEARDLADREQLDLYRPRFLR